MGSEGWFLKDKHETCPLAKILLIRINLKLKNQMICDKKINHHKV